MAAHGAATEAAAPAVRPGRQLPSDKRATAAAAAAGPSSTSLSASSSAAGTAAAAAATGAVGRSLASGGPSRLRQLRDAAGDLDRLEALIDSHIGAFRTKHIELALELLAAWAPASPTAAAAAVGAPAAPPGPPPGLATAQRLAAALVERAMALLASPDQWVQPGCQVALLRVPRALGLAADARWVLPVLSAALPCADWMTPGELVAMLEALAAPDMWQYAPASGTLGRLLALRLRRRLAALLPQLTVGQLAAALEALAAAAPSGAEALLVRQAERWGVQSAARELEGFDVGGDGGGAASVADVAAAARRLDDAFAARVMSRVAVALGRRDVAAGDAARLLFAIARFRRWPGAATLRARSSSDPRCLVRLVWALCELRWAPGRAWWEEMLAALAAAAPRLEPDQLCTVLGSFGRTGLQPPPGWVAALLEPSLPKLPSFHAASCVALAFALARLGFRPPASFLGPFLARCREQLPHMDGRQLANLLWALHRLGLQRGLSPSWRAAFLAASRALLPPPPQPPLQQQQPQPQPKGSAARGARGTPHRAGPGAEAGAEARRAPVPAAPAPAPFTPSQLALLLLTLAKAGLPLPMRWRRAFWDASLPALGGMGPVALAAVLNGVWRTRGSPPLRWTRAWMAASQQALPHASVSVLLQFATFLLAAPLRPPGSWVAAFRARMEHLTASLSRRELDVCLRMVRVVSHRRRRTAPPGWRLSCARSTEEAAARWAQWAERRRRRQRSRRQLQFPATEAAGPAAAATAADAAASSAKAGGQKLRRVVMRHRAAAAPAPAPTTKQALRQPPTSQPSPLPAPPSPPAPTAEPAAPAATAATAATATAVEAEAARGRGPKARRRVGASRGG
ncbi:hypothetical protein GPECTOR_23g65 [Gonium pectorale]|uniref:Uncharacterized protein n=1 Tax=Gonium pectorale TaxID=33097 RepID=A0A150GH52_GONPE|nr:hypothetical protein GPECTOR_23g65 [Gonium pectorale]|eukprot:KXZ49137.1 hypothetical protein GPECTOR_23g65 [Gonium pectorale]